MNCPTTEVVKALQTDFCDHFGKVSNSRQPSSSGESKSTQYRAKNARYALSSQSLMADYSDKP